MTVTVNSTAGLVNLAVTYKDLTAKKQTVHYLLVAGATQAATDTVMGNILNDIDQLTNAQITRVSSSVLPAVAGLKAAPLNNVATSGNLSVPYVKNYCAFTFIGGTVNAAGNLVDYPVIVPAPSNVTVTSTGAVIAFIAASVIGDLVTQFQANGAYPVGYASGQRTFHSGDLLFAATRSGYQQLTATTINA